MRNEHTANLVLGDTMASAAAERARWAAVLAPAVRTVAKRRAVRKSLLTRLLALFA